MSMLNVIQVKSVSFEESLHQYHVDDQHELMVIRNILDVYVIDLPYALKSEGNPLSFHSRIMLMGPQGSCSMLWGLMDFTLIYRQGVTIFPRVKFQICISQIMIYK